MPDDVIVGYLRRLDGTDDDAVRQLVLTMRNFADAKRLVLTMVFVEQEPGVTSTLGTMTRYCLRHGIRQVVVPSEPHLNRLPGLAALSRELLAQSIGGQVWIATEGEDT
ncbi:hypothetical protein [Streptomyces acidiscabies]|uniref:Resolvase/invertase-type recombinase catalytic domain-containing protein n=1 Tax=Streptomyces acidiscabies TaxID=42234 RepID=A0AAP6BF54_9ACTN|nr:hypothetical protein [Streptomyces acidiscabies]MBP5936872.1 hypothetical protein [Streptomyces sp. LBUM 1476]MBZ3915112.1 hypothetical protein [Streptomyces acidiscabies]MDX2963615.1 hypothetical protein [Streptomyces acidiscabies]MDX3021174.1 hypothetical protein [Streptomyces acidiscabies]MDX3794769.1 hypothetical protein [Streptomyces acidiscabies]